MSYSKLFLVTQDFALGKQSVTQALDNNQALYDLYTAKHAVGVDGLSTGGFQNPFHAYGRHNDIRIARTTARFTIARANTSRAVASAIITGPMLQLTAPHQVATGQWRLSVYTPQLFGAVAQVEAASAVDRKATCYVTYSPTVGPTVTVSTWEASGGGAFSLTDLDFSITLWAQST